MCIASFKKLKDRFVFTFTRDERLDRPFQSPAWVDSKVFAPLDLEAGGTWIGLNSTRIISLQNGGTVKHNRQLPYDKSRGKLLLDLLINEDWLAITKILEANHIEPFTLTEIDIYNKDIYLHVYENKQLTRTKIGDNTQFINCSSTLYDATLKTEFQREFTATKFENETELMTFHIQHAIGSARNPLQKPSSTSITQFILDNKLTCKFLDLTQGDHPQEMTVIQ